MAMLGEDTMVGIVAGVIVFTVTIIVVFTLLYSGGTFSRLSEQSIPAFSTLELHDHLIAARKALPLKPKCETLAGYRIILKPLDPEADVADLYKASDGSEWHKYPAYDPEVVWRFQTHGPFASAAELKNYLIELHNEVDGLTFCVIDKESGQKIGLAGFIENVPSSLRIGLRSIVLTPAFRGTPLRHDILMLLLDYAFSAHYRRVEYKVHSTDSWMREFISKAGFFLEGIMRKHHVVRDQSRDTAVYAALNTDWPVMKHTLERKLKKKRKGKTPIDGHDKKE